MQLRANPMIANPGPESIELAPRAAEAIGVRVSRQSNLQHALAAEHIRIRHICKALACAADDGLHRRWRAAMAESLARVRDIENALCLNGSQADQSVAAVMDECLLEAMELARANGDSRAAQTVAQECMALVELYCTRLQQGHAAAFDPAGDGIHCRKQDAMGNISDAMAEEASGCDNGPAHLAGRLQHRHGTARGFSADAEAREGPSGDYNGYCRFANSD